MRRVWHFLRALALVGAALSVFLGVQIAANRKLLPGWQQILTRPVGELIAYGSGRDHRASPADVAIELIVPAPQLNGEPLRVAGLPTDSLDGEGAGKPSSGHRSLGPTERDNAEGLVARPDPRLPVSRIEPRSDPSKAALGQENDGTREPAPARSVASPAVDTSTELARLLATGADLVRDGVNLPRLVADWSLQDIELLIRRGEGLVVVEGRGELYRIVLENHSLLTAKEFRALTSEVRSRVSNRGLCLNCTPEKGAAQSPFARLEQEFERRVGSAFSGQRPRIIFFPSSVLDAHLARKQLGAVASVGVDLTKLESLEGTVTTVGTIVVDPQGTKYLIREIHVGNRVIPYDDPEAALAVSSRRTSR